MRTAAAAVKFNDVRDITKVSRHYGGFHLRTLRSRTIDPVPI